MYKILVIEDEEKIRDIIKESLGKWGFEAYEVNNFNNVFDEFVQINPELVLMEVNLPAFDGFYWCNKIRSVSKVPVIFL